METKYYKLAIGALLAVGIAALSAAALRGPTPEEARAALVKLYDSEKMEELAKASQAMASGAWLRSKADEMANLVGKARAKAIRIERWAKDCSAANKLGTLEPAVSCDIIQSEPSKPRQTKREEAEAVISSVVSSLPKVKPKLVLSYGHGLNPTGKWADVGATAGGTTEREVILKIGEAAEKVVKTDAIIGKVPSTLAGQLEKARQLSKEWGCGLESPCFMVSIHADKREDSTSSGSIVFYDDADVKSTVVARELSSCLGSRMVPDNKNRHGRLAMVRDVGGFGSVLLESGNLTNPQELESMRTKFGTKLGKCLNTLTN